MLGYRQTLRGCCAACEGLSGMGIINRCGLSGLGDMSMSSQDVQTFLASNPNVAALVNSFNVAVQVMGQYDQTLATAEPGYYPIPPYGIQVSDIAGTYGLVTIYPGANGILYYSSNGSPSTTTGIIPGVTAPGTGSSNYESPSGNSVDQTECDLLSSVGLSILCPAGTQPSSAQNVFTPFLIAGALILGLAWVSK